MIFATQAVAAATADYEVWGADQSNTAVNQVGLGLKGSYLWIWTKQDIETQVQGGADAVPLPCLHDETTGPCDILSVFP